jgi:hypothetical protein
MRRAGFSPNCDVKNGWPGHPFLLSALLSQQIDKVRGTDKGRQQPRRDLIREDAGASIIEPLAVSSEYGMNLQNRESIGQLISVLHRRHSDIVRGSIWMSG